LKIAIDDFPLFSFKEFHWFLASMDASIFSDDGVVHAFHHSLGEYSSLQHIGCFHRYKTLLSKQALHV